MPAESNFKKLIRPPKKTKRGDAMMVDVLITYPITLRGDRNTDGSLGLWIYNDESFGNFVTVFCLEDSSSFADVLGADMGILATPTELRNFLDVLPKSVHYLCIDPKPDHSAAVFVCIAELRDFV